jgi:hypothetical protein
MVRHIRLLYGSFIIYCLGMCKSAGTLIALGADQIRMSKFGELGPLDVQIAKPDEFNKQSSGLDMTVALQQLGEEAFERFESYFLALKKRSGDVITTRTAAQIASDIAVGLFNPISAQIDPLRLAENFRQLEIAREYGRRLRVQEATLEHLIKGYPSHDFVIDFEEAKSWFSNVQPLDAEDVEFEKALEEKIKSDHNQNLIRFPSYDNPIYGPIVSSKSVEEKSCSASPQTDGQRRTPVSGIIGPSVPDSKSW